MIPKLLVGPPGIGKTARVKAKYDHVEVLLLSSSAEEDVSGIPFIKDGEEQRTVPKFIRQLQEADRAGKTTCLFLDEIDKSRREVADTLLSLVVDPGSFGIPESTVIMAAANPPEWGGGDGISSAMLSRWCVINMNMDKDAVEHQISYWKDRYAGQREVLEMVDRIMEQASVHGIIDCAGEGLERRLTCPRTLTMALDSMAENDGDVVKIASGLLTRPFSSLFISNSKIFEIQSKVSRFQGKARKASSKSGHQPIRVTT
ncbi:MAG: AAA family ATPase [Dehalococcoidia bacterium]|jgi:replication-associated recombination protein RarA